MSNRSLLVGWLILCSCFLSQGKIYRINPWRDGGISSANPDSLSFNSAASVPLGYGGQGAYRPWFNFAISEVGYMEEVVDVELRIKIQTQNDISFNLYEALDAIRLGEGICTWNNSPPVGSLLKSDIRGKVASTYSDAMYLSIRSSQLSDSVSNFLIDNRNKIYWGCYLIENDSTEGYAYLQTRESLIKPELRITTVPIDNANPALPVIYVLDVRPYLNTETAGRKYDIQHIAAVLQGLANRQYPRIFLVFEDNDLFWLDVLIEKGGFCEGWKVEWLSDIYSYINMFSKYADGVVLYDSNPDTGVISTSLVATTVGAVENSLAVRKDTSAGSLYNYLVNDASGPRLPIVLDLTGKFTGSGIIWQTDIPSTGSAKCDAYLWAVEKYIKTGKADSTELSYSLDLWGLKMGGGLGSQLRMLDYSVSKRAFCFELSPWGDEIPNDDSSQPLGADLNTFIGILDACNAENEYDKMIHTCGFPNWAYKYTTSVGGIHEPVPTEWEFMRLVSAYNGYTDVEFGSSNTSFYSSLKPAVDRRRYTQNPPPSYQKMQSEGLIDANGNVAAGNYIAVVMGDYDSPAWTLYRVGGAGGVYEQDSRGSVSANWGINPNLIEKVPVAMDYYFRHKSDRDYFAAWDSGCGYVNPGQFYGNRQSGYPSIIPQWQKLCRDYYRQMDYSVTAWVLNGYQTLTTADAANYSAFSGDGVGFHDYGNPLPNMYLSGNTPIKVISGSSNATQYGLMNKASGVNFGWYRAVNWDMDGQQHYTAWGPDHTQQLMQQYSNSGNNHRFLDIYTFYYLMRYYLGGNNDYRAAWIADNVPRIMETGQTYTINITVRNDGWNSWPRSLSYGIGFSIVPEGTNPAYYKRCYGHDGSEVITGESIIYTFDITAPQAPGVYDVQYDMVREGVTWFASRGNIEWKTSVIVTDDLMSIDTDADGLPDTIENQIGTLYWHPDDKIIHPKVDLNQDGIVNLCDFAKLSEFWQKLIEY